MFTRLHGEKYANYDGQIEQITVCPIQFALEIGVLGER